MVSYLNRRFRQTLITGSAKTQRINVNGDFAVTWQITPKISATNLFSYWDFTMPGHNTFTETDYAGTTLLAPPGATTTTTTSDAQYLNQKTKANTFVVAWDAAARASISIGFRYRSRLITQTGGEVIPIHEDWGLFGAALRPTPQWRVNFNVEAMYADNSYYPHQPASASALRRPVDIQTAQLAYLLGRSQYSGRARQRRNSQLPGPQSKLLVWEHNRSGRALVA